MKGKSNNYVKCENKKLYIFPKRLEYFGIEEKIGFSFKVFSIVYW